MTIIEALYGRDIKQEEFFKALIGEFKKADESEYVAIYNRYIPYFWADRSAYTARNLYQSVLKELKATKMAKTKKEAIESIFTLSTGFFTALNTISQNKEIERMNDKTEFSIDHHIAQMIELKNSIVEKRIKGHGVQSDEQATANAIAVYLAMATGRRTLEILQTLTIVKQKGEIYFSGLAKKGEDDESLYPAILLDDDFLFINKSMEKMRKILGTQELTPKQINQKYSVVLNRASAKLLGENVTMHELRERYAEICVQVKRPAEMDEGLFRDFVLGHETKLKASDFYKSQKGV